MEKARIAVVPQDRPVLLNCVRIVSEIARVYVAELTKRYLPYEDQCSRTLARADRARETRRNSGIPLQGTNPPLEARASSRCEVPAFVVKTLPTQARISLPRHRQGPFDRWRRVEVAGRCRQPADQIFSFPCISNPSVTVQNPVASREEDSV
jgi:hypothetical protein